MKKLIILFALLVIFPYSLAHSAFNAIDLVKSKIPSDMKNRMWYVGNWEQEKIGKNLWKVTVSNGIWKVSREKNICSETGEYVSLCSVNGTAKTYSKFTLSFCKPSFICENKKLNISRVNISEELKKIDVSNLSYSEEIINGWKYTIVSVPEPLKRAIYYQASKHQKNYPEASMDETSRVLAKQYGLPEKAVMAIFLEGIPRNWE